MKKLQANNKKSKQKAISGKNKKPAISKTEIKETEVAGKVDKEPQSK